MSLVNSHALGASQNLLVLGIAVLYFVTGATALNSGSFDGAVQPEDDASPAAQDTTTQNTAATPVAETKTPTTDPDATTEKTGGASIATANAASVIQKTTLATTNIEVQTVKSSPTESATTHASYNQWGFTGDQSAWAPPSSTLSASSVTGSKVTSSIATIHNLTSNAARAFDNSIVSGRSWKKVFMLGSIFGATALLHAI
jgi:hypothetical protein